MNFLQANREVFKTISHPYTWVAFAWEELRDRYKRTMLGLIWIPLAFILFVGVKVLIFSKLNNTGLDVFTVHVVVGYWVWQTLNSLITDSCVVFVRSSGYIKSSPLPYSTYILQGVFRNSIPFFYNFLIVVGLCWFATGTLSVEFLYVIPAFLIYALNGIWLSLLLGVLAARFRDVLHLIQTMMRVLFFMTPIIWMPEQLGKTGALIALYNPFAHFIEIIRSPVAGNGFPLTSWMIVIGITVVGWIIGTLVYAKARPVIVHWV